jgi:hypothetical protein
MNFVLQVFCELSTDPRVLAALLLVTQLVADVALDQRVTAALARKTGLLEATGLSA